MEQWNQDDDFDSVRQYTALPVSAPELDLSPAPLREKPAVSPNKIRVLQGRPQNVVRVPGYSMLYVPPPVIEAEQLRALQRAAANAKAEKAATRRRLREQRDISKEWGKLRAEKAAQSLFVATMANIDPLVEQLAVLDAAARKAALHAALERYRQGAAAAVEDRFQRLLKRGVKPRAALKRALSSELASWVVRGIRLNSGVSGLGGDAGVSETEAVVTAAGAVLASVACTSGAEAAAKEYAAGSGLSERTVEQKRAMACAAAQRLRAGRERSALDRWLGAFGLANTRLKRGGGKNLSQALSAYFDFRVGKSARDLGYPLFQALVTAADMQRQGRRRMMMAGGLRPLPEVFGNRVEQQLALIVARSPANQKERNQNFYRRVAMDGAGILGVRLLNVNMTPEEQAQWMKQGVSGLMVVAALGLGWFLYNRATSLDHLKKAPGSPAKLSEATT